MRAVAVTEFRGVPKLVDLPVPEAGLGEVRIHLEAAGVNPFDWKIVDGILSPRRPHVFPLVLGVDGAGVVDQAGAGVTRFAVGDRVFGDFLHDPVGSGTYAEFLTVPEAIPFARLPPPLSAVQGAALPLAGMAALTAIDYLDPQPDATILIVGASGGVGSFAVQLAARRGAKVVATVRGNGGSRLRALGAREIVDIEGGPLLPQIRQRHPDGIDTLLDLVSDARTFAELAALVKPGGAAATTVFVADPPSLLARQVRAENIDARPRRDLLERLGADAAAGTLVVPVEAQVSLDEAPRIVAEGRQGKLRGKTVLRIR